MIPLRALPNSRELHRADLHHDEPTSKDSSSRLRSVGFRPLRVLVIDDSDSRRMDITSVLRQAECKVFELPSAIGATRIALRERIDLAIVDMAMLGDSGNKLVSLFRSNSRLRTITIIVISSRSEDDLDPMVKNPGINGVLSRSLVRTQLAAMVDRLTSARRADSRST